MTKKQTAAAARPEKKSRFYYGLVLWKCNHYANRSEILAYVEASGKWEVVAVIPPTSGASAEELATFVTRIINAAQQNRDLLRDAMNALEAVMKDGLTYSTEQEADSVVTSIKRVVS